MCLIAHREAESGLVIPNDVIEHNLNKNPDGYGFAVRRPSGVRWERFAPQDWKRFVQRLDHVNRETDLELAVHFRLATHGTKTKSNAHPYSYVDPEEGRVLVFHNGIISIKTEEGESDTAAFVRRILTRLPSRWWHNPALVYLVEEAIGWSRILLMTEKETVRLNPTAWEDRGIVYSCSPGVWKSEPRKNTQAFPPPTRSPNSNLEYVQYDWMHNGHAVVKMNESEWGGESFGDVKCYDCEREGTWWVDDEFVVIDLEHDKSVPLKTLVSPKTPARQQPRLVGAGQQKEA